jgi:glycosyltransferase involved in cell wall biosynthesis
MNIKLCIRPTLSEVTPENGIGQVVIAQHKYLPELGFDIVGPETADVIASHVVKANMPRVDVLHCHGLYWGDTPHIKFTSWHKRANHDIAESARLARFITVPSDWVADIFRRDMRIDPFVIWHGIDAEEWSVQPHKGYALWNKTRGKDVCDSTPAFELAQRGYKVITTFAPEGIEHENLKVCGAVPFQDMKVFVQNSEVYLATTMETFGIGTLEALAAGVPVLGWKWGGTEDIIAHKETGYLVEPGDYDGLAAGYEYLRKHRARISGNCRDAAVERFSWKAAMEGYAWVYEQCMKPETKKVSIIITNYNYGKYVADAIGSALNQNDLPDEIIVVDDGSTDNSREIISKFKSTDKTKIKFIFQENRGVAAARNNGIREATGDYITCLDADDMIEPEFVKILREELYRNRNLGIVYSGLLILTEDGGSRMSPWPPEFDWNIMCQPHVPPSNCIPSGCMFRKDMWERAGGYFQQYAPGEDAEFWVRGLSVGFDAKKVTNNPLFLYRAHSHGASKTKPYKPIDTWHPWMRDKRFPFAAPASNLIEARSYHKPLVTVIIPVGPGHLQYLPSAIESLLGQSFRSWNVIVVMDSDERIDYPQYPFLKVVYSGGKGAGNARNLGLAYAEASLVLFLDADDLLAPGGLETMVKAYVEGEGKYYIYGDYAKINGKGEIDVVNTWEYDQLASIEKPQDGHGVTVLMNRSDAIKVSFDEQLSSFEDVDFFSKCATMGICGKKASGLTFYYRVSTGTRRPKNINDRERLHKIVTDRYKPFLTGEAKIMSCCGGSQSTSILRAKQHLQGFDLPEEPSVGEDGLVRMEYIGLNLGAISFTVNGHIYRGGQNPSEKYANVRIEDVKHLELSGKWQRVKMPIPQPVIVEQEVVIPSQSVVVPEVTTVVEVIQEKIPIKKIVKGKRK